MGLTTALLLAGIALRVSGQGFTSIGGFNFTNKVDICGQTFNNANISGITSWNPQVPQLQQPGQPKNTGGTTSNVAWGVTVTETKNTPNASAQWDLWFSNFGANYSSDLTLGYDVCITVIGTVVDDVYWRAAKDNGSCTTALDTDCVNALQTQAQTFVLSEVLDSDSTIRANLTAGSAGKVCERLGHELNANFPKECQKFMNTTRPITTSTGAWTSNNDTYLNKDADGCFLTDSNTDASYYHVYTLNEYTLNNPNLANVWYDVFSYLTVPLMLTFLPVANHASLTNIQQAKSFLRCPRATNIQPGSSTPSAAPTPTPLGGGGGLSGGAIAGIVIGVLAAVALIGGLAFFFWRRRRAPKKLETIPPNDPPAYPPDEKVEPVHTPMVEAPAGTVGPQELSPDNEVGSPPAELRGDTQHIAEKEGDLSPLHSAEKEGGAASSPPAELAADPPIRHDHNL